MPFARDNLAQLMDSNGAINAAVIRTTYDAVTHIFFQPEIEERANLLDRKPNDNTIILKATLKVGTKWEINGGESEIMEVNATVDTPAGRFEDVLKGRTTRGNSIITEYFQHGDGMVKREVQSEGARIASILKKFSRK